MGFPDSLSAYPDIEGLLDKALASTKGLKLTFADAAQARFNSGRIHAYRVRLKRENARTYPVDHPMYNKTPYDGLQVRLRDCIVEIEKMSVDRYNIEDLA